MAAQVLRPNPCRATASQIITHVADLCCGMGGLALAAKQLGMRIVAGVDLNPNALRTFEKNFPNATTIEGSVRSEKILERCNQLLKPGDPGSGISIVVSGPPCQGFSAAGPRDPGDPRNQVLVAVARAIATLQPDCALVENVSMILSDDHLERLEKFESTLFDAGYAVFSVLLNAGDFGVPQRRERAFFLVTRVVLDETRVHDRLAQLKTSPPTVATALQGLSSPPLRPEHYIDEHDCGPISNHFAMRHSQRVIEKISNIPPGSGPMSYRRLHPTRLSNTLFSGHRAPPAHFSEPRSITVREAARLQGFPDEFRIFGRFANQMEQVTNAVPPPLAKVVLRVLVEEAGLPVKLNG
jgi:DNA (cytosine-5)-methyltransferase 1